MKTMKFNRVIIHGFRCTGKSTVARLLAKTLSWQLVEMDQEIITRSGKSMAELTKNGTEWNEMRNIEAQILKDSLQLDKTIISSGGGLAVNPFTGQANMILVKSDKATLNVLLTADNSVIADRIRNGELALKNDFNRPILNQDVAKKVSETLDEQTRLQILVNDSLSTFEKRKPLYAQITKNVIASTIKTPEIIASEIINLLNQEND